MEAHTPDLVAPLQTAVVKTVTLLLQRKEPVSKPLVDGSFGPNQMHVVFIVHEHISRTEPPAGGVPRGDLLPHVEIPRKYIVRPGEKNATEIEIPIISRDLPLVRAPIPVRLDDVGNTEKYTARFFSWTFG
jgi:hypothetical protein